MIRSSAWDYRKASTYAARPPMVTLISLLQFAKAALIAYIAWHAWEESPVVWGTSAFWRVVFIVTNGRSGPIFLQITPLLVAYAFAAGCGLLFLQNWARKTVMAASGLNALYWTLALALSSWRPELGLRLSQPGFDQQSVFMLVFIDLLVFLCLAWGRNVPEAFAQYS